MKRTLLLIASAFLAVATASAADENISIRIVETTDVHGCFLPYDFINRRPQRGSLARVSTYVKDLREVYGDNVILLENGDILQGQPIAYYYNYVAAAEENIAASMMNYMGYDVQTYGNHDIETGHAVYDKWAGECKAELVCANVISTDTGEPYQAAYKVLERAGMRIAVLGMLTPAIPNWLGESLWSGLRFEDMKASAGKWAAIIREREHPDLLIGLFHSGLSGGITTEEYEENASERVAREVPGFDAVFFGHDHSQYCGTVKNTEDKDVWLLNPANNAMNVAELSVTAVKGDDGIHDIKLSGRIVDVREMPIDQEFEEEFEEARKKVTAFTEEEIGRIDKTLYSSDCFFGSAAFTDLIHNIQLDLTGADISFSAPLQVNAVVKAGFLHVSDMFNLYKYENRLCVMRLTGQEIKDYLEMSYALWTNTMASAGDHLMLVDEKSGGGRTSAFFHNPTYNFDSAAGIDYEVDVTKPEGEKVRILQMSDGRAFDPKAEYKVAINSYRANNGGELLTKGAGLKKDDIQGRIEWESELDLRNYMMEYIREKKTLSPEANGNWKFVPEEWAAPAAERDRKLIFGK